MVSSLISLALWPLIEYQPLSGSSLCVLPHLEIQLEWLRANSFFLFERPERRRAESSSAFRYASSHAYVFPCEFTREEDRVVQRRILIMKDMNRPLELSLGSQMSSNRTELAIRLQWKMSYPSNYDFSWTSHEQGSIETEISKVEEILMIREMKIF